MYLLCAAISPFLLPSESVAKTLTQAVNEEIGLVGVSTPCLNLNISMLTGPLYDICTRAFPAGTPIDSIGASTNSISTDSTTNLLLQDKKKNTYTESNSNDNSTGSKWTLFATADGGAIKRDISSQDDGYSSQLIRFLMGGTYAANSSNLLGFALIGKNQKGDYSSGGNFKETALGVRLFEVYYPSENTFMQLAGGINSAKTQRTRHALFSDQTLTVSGTPSADFSYNQYELSLLAGYNYASGSWVVTPQLGITWLAENFGTYTESGNSGLELVIHDDQRRSLKSNVGLQASMNISTGSGVMIPQFDLRWIHEFADKSRQVNFSFAYDSSNVIFTYDTEAADRDYGEAAVGLAYVMSKGKQAFARVQTVIGQEFYHSTIYSIGLNIEM